MAATSPFFSLGLLVGFLVTAPVGPICILCIQRSIAFGRSAGIASGLGSAIVLSLYGTLGAAGINILAHAPFVFHLIVSCLGAVILMVIGWKLFRTVPDPKTPEIRHSSLRGAMLSTLVLELINPASILIFFGLFVSMRTDSLRSGGDLVSIASGIFVSSMLWWITLSFTISLFRRFIGVKTMGWLNRCAGIFIIVLGLRPLLEVLHP